MSEEQKIETEKMMVTTVPAGQIGELGWAKWGRNLLTFLQPLFSIYLGYLATTFATDGFQWTDFIPNQFIAGSMGLYVVNALTDLNNKFSTVKRYLNGENV